MPKATLGFDPNLYAPVAERITLFLKSYPTGRVITELVSRSAHEVVFKASIYRNAEDEQPAATGWASEREGDGDVNLVACLENTETSAVGRALANLGFTAAKERPSTEEMAKAARARARYAAIPRVRSISEDPVQHHANIVTDVLRLIASAERRGMRPARAGRWRARLIAGRFSEARLVKWEQRLRAWLAKHSA